MATHEINSAADLLTVLDTVVDMGWRGGVQCFKTADGVKFYQMAITASDQTTRDILTVRIGDTVTIGGAGVTVASGPKTIGL